MVPDSDGPTPVNMGDRPTATQGHCDIQFIPQPIPNRADSGLFIGGESPHRTPDPNRLRPQGRDFEDVRPPADAAVDENVGRVPHGCGHLLQTAGGQVTQQRRQPPVRN